MTIRDIASMAGVSVATVSRVINNTGYVSAKTRENIENLIEEYDFRPNAVARSLIRNDTEMIAVVLPGRLNPFFAKILDAVNAWAEREGNSVLFYNTEEDSEKEYHAIVRAIEQRVRGILLLPVMESMKRTVELLNGASRTGVAVVLVDRDMPGASFDSVFIDNSQVVYEAINLLVEKGHRNIGIVTCPEALSKGRGRLDGYRRCLSEWQLAVQDDYIYHGEFNEQSGYDACSYFLEQKNPPTAILATCSSVTLGCIRYFSEHGLTAGKDVALVGFDDIELLHAIGYQLTVITRPMSEIAELACGMLAEQMRKSKSSRNSRKIFLEPEIQLRGSEKLSVKEI